MSYRFDHDDHYWEPYCPECNQSPCECEVDVCQNCGGYFLWTKALAEIWRKRWNPRPNERQPQRCRSCIIDETWVEGRL